MAIYCAQGCNLSLRLCGGWFSVSGIKAVCSENKLLSCLCALGGLLL